MVTRRTLLAGAGAAAMSALQPRRLFAVTNPLYGLVVYGGTPSGIMAACAGAREGIRVALALGNSPLGGVVANGLGATDLKSNRLVGGMPLAFFQAVGQHYGEALSWQVEPHVALAVFQSFLTQYEVDVYAGYVTSVAMQASVITAIQLTTGTVLKGSNFIDASYEGDFMAAAGVANTYGREAHSQYGETLAGYGIVPTETPISPYDKQGKLLPGVSAYPNETVGQADAAIQTYNYRLCLSNDPTNKVPFAAPAGYDRNKFAVFGEMYQADPTATFGPTALPNNKFDLNTDVAFGPSAAYPGADAAGRNHVWQQYYLLHAGFMYFMANDTSVPKAIRDQVNQYGLAADEFTDNGNWPRQLYIREARRMIGRYVMTQADLETVIHKTDSIGLGGYHIDCHDTIMYAAPDGNIGYEGGFVVPQGQPRIDTTNVYQIPYRALQPQVAQASNLLVTVCMSASHVAFCSLRIEVQYMVMGEAAGVAAGMASVARIRPHQLAYAALASKLKGYGAILVL